MRILHGLRSMQAPLTPLSPGARKKLNKIGSSMRGVECDCHLAG